MARPFTRQQAHENRAFLAALAQTGNVREAARSLGVHRATYCKRRARDPAFAAQWDAALALAAAALNGPHGAAPMRRPSAVSRRGADLTGTLTLMRSGRVQLRRLRPGRLGRAAQQAFLAALSASANVRLSASAAGFSHSAFYQLARRDPGFAREWDLALAMGWRRVEAALVAGFLPTAYGQDDWRSNDPPAVPPMSVTQALQCLHLHERRVSGGRYPPQVRRRRGESEAAYEGRMLAIQEAWYAREREKFAVAEAERVAGTWTGPKPEPLYVLPDLAQVTGWSKADPARTPHDEDRALFGGWRLDHWHRRLDGEGEG